MVRQPGSGDNLEELLRKVRELRQRLHRLAVTPAPRS